MKTEVIEEIGMMIPEGNRLELPKDVQFKFYPQVKKALVTAGGIYKRCGFNFKEDAADIQARLTGGEIINDVKKFQYFPTPKNLATYMANLAEVSEYHTVLEPSAGQGAIADIVLSKFPKIEITLVELMSANITALRRKGYDNVIKGDFLKCDGLGEGYDRIIANPPFTKNQDIDHVLHMYDKLNDDGILVSVMSSSWTFGSQKKQVAFREWLDKVGAVVEQLPEGTFKESGTTVKTILVKIIKTV